MHQKSFLAHNPAGFHKIAYAEWGDASLQSPIICVHGLTRNGRDFDVLATALSDKRRLLCPDVAGRGKSDFLPDPAFYSYAQYINDTTALIARANTAQVDWVGTSMGGILGMLMAAEPNTPIRRMVVNDVGPFLPMEALKRIGTYAGIQPEFADLVQAERYMRQIYAPFGITRDADWKHMAETGVRTLPNGKLTLAYDPAIAKPFADINEPVDFWATYDRITCPILLIRGAHSDILSAETAHAMTQRGPKAKLVTIPNVGHAPALMDNDQVKLISDFLGG